MATFAQEYSGGLTISLIGHALLALMFGFNLITMPFMEAPPVQLAIEATVIDMGAISRQQEADLQQRQRELDRQQQAAVAERRKEVEAQQREQEQLIEKERQQEVEQKRLAEQKRLEDIEQKRLADEKRKVEAERQRLAEQQREKEAEQKRQAEAARVAEEQRKEAERLRQQEIQRQFQSEIEAEEALLAAMSSGKMQQYKAAIISRVTRNWVKPVSAKPGIECEVRVSQIPGGEIVSVRVGDCNGDSAVVRSIEAAVYRASPLPPPPDPSLFDRTLIFTFRPEE